MRQTQVSLQPHGLMAGAEGQDEMRLLVVNPNTSAEMTETILAGARRAARAGVRVDALNPTRGPASVEGRLDEIVSGYWALDAVLPVAHEYDGLVVACYGNHPLIGALREVLTQPVVGIMEASILHALPLGERFSIVTTSPQWRPLLQEGVRILGLESRCASVRTSALSALDTVDLPADVVHERLCDAARLAVEQDGAEVICLGCAGMAGLAEAVGAATGVPVVDGVSAAVTLVRGLVETGAGTSKRTLYRAPIPRRAIDLPPALAAVYERSTFSHVDGRQDAPMSPGGAAPGHQVTGEEARDGGLSTLPGSPSLTLGRLATSPDDGSPR
jgi:allantoin racemase